MGLAASDMPTADQNYKIAYYAPEPRAVVEVVDFDDANKVVGFGQTGRVKLTTLTKELFVPGFLERDEGEREQPGAKYPWDGVSGVRPYPRLRQFDGGGRVLGGERMPSPFPGMDPYLEEPAIWTDFHGTLLMCIRAELNRLLPRRYVARWDRYVWMDDPEIEIAGLVGRPDTFVTDVLEGDPAADRRRGDPCRPRYNRAAHGRPKGKAVFEDRGCRQSAGGHGG